MSQAHRGLPVEGAAGRAYAHVRELVLSGNLAPGTRLVTRTLAAKMGTSLNPVREALGRLASEGIVEHVPGAGAFVRQLGRHEIEEIYGMREALEPYAAEQAARLATVEELDELEAILQGEKLAPFWRDAGGKGVNIKRMFTEPRTFDLVLWVQGTAAGPYLEEGKVTDQAFWNRIQRGFGGQFFWFALWVN